MAMHLAVKKFVLTKNWLGKLSVSLSNVMTNSVDFFSGKLNCVLKTRRRIRWAVCYLLFGINAVERINVDSWFWNQFFLNIYVVMWQTTTACWSIRMNSSCLTSTLIIISEEILKKCIHLVQTNKTTTKHLSRWINLERLSVSRSNMLNYNSVISFVIVYAKKD